MAACCPPGGLGRVLCGGVLALDYVGLACVAAAALTLLWIAWRASIILWSQRRCAPGALRARLCRAYRWQRRAYIVGRGRRRWWGLPLADGYAVLVLARSTLVGVAGVVMCGVGVAGVVMCGVGVAGVVMCGVGIAVIVSTRGATLMPCTGR